MKRYVVTLTESDGEMTVVGRYATLEEAQSHLRSVRFYPQYRRSEESLDLSEDGMSGTGYDESGQFTYNIVEKSKPTPCYFGLVMYRNGQPREFKWSDGYLLDCATGERTPMSWEGWQMLPHDLKQQGFKPYVD